MTDYKLRFISPLIEAVDENQAIEKALEDQDRYPSDWELTEDNSNWSVEEHQEGESTEWVLVAVSKDGIELFKMMDEWLKQPMEVRNQYLLDLIRKKNQVVFKVLLPERTIRMVAKYNWCMSKEGKQDALTWLHSTMSSWCQTKKFHTIVWLAITPEERYEQIKLFQKYMNKYCVNGKMPNDYYSHTDTRFYHRFEDEAFKVWGAIKEESK